MIKKWIILFNLWLITVVFAFDNPRLAIIIGKTSFEQKWGVTQMAAHGWGAIANLAGIPYDCYFLEDLPQVNLSRHQTLIFGQCSHVNDSLYSKLVPVVKKYLHHGGNLIIDGPLAIFDEKGQERMHQDLDTLIGVHYNGFRGNDQFRIKVSQNDHYVTEIFQPNQFLTQHLVNGLNIMSGGETLLVTSDEKNSFPFLSILDTEINRTVYISDLSTWSGAASFFRNVQPQVFYRNQLFNVMIRAIHWSLYDELKTPFPAPQISNANLTAIIRLDADGSGNLNEQITTINYLVDIARETGVVPVYGWVSSQATKAGWQDLAPLGKKLEDVGGEIGTHSRIHRINSEMTEERWRDELDESIKEIEFNTSDYDYPIGEVECFINPGNTIKMNDYEQVARRFSFYMTHGFEQDMPLGFGNFTWYTGDYKNLAMLEDTPSPDYQWFNDPTWSYTTQQITAYEEAIFDHMFENIGRGVIFNQMWHDYSITTQPQSGKDRIVNKSNIAMYDAIKNKFAAREIYCPTPIELGHKLRLMAQWDYQWQAEGDKIIMTLDLTKVNLDTMPYFTGGMGVTIENTEQVIQSVSLNGRRHMAFNDRLVILPNLTKNRHKLEIQLGYQPPVQPHLAYVSQILPSCQLVGDDLQVALVTRNKARFRFFAPDGYVLLNTDGQKRDPLHKNQLCGYVTSNRTVILKKITDTSFAITFATFRIEDIKSEKNKITFQVKTNDLDRNQLWFRTRSTPKAVQLAHKAVTWIKTGEEYRITLPKIEKDDEIVIQL